MFLRACVRACVCACMKPLVALNSSTDLLFRKISVAGKLSKFTCREISWRRFTRQIYVQREFSKLYQNPLLWVQRVYCLRSVAGIVRQCVHRVQCSVVQCNTVPYRTVPYRTVLYCTVLYCTALPNNTGNGTQTVQQSVGNSWLSCDRNCDDIKFGSILVLHLI